MMHAWFIGFKVHPGDIAGKNMVRPFFFLPIFLNSRNYPKRFRGLIFWFLWIGRAKNPWPGPLHHLAVEVFNVGGWLTHGDLALSVSLDFLAVTEHRLIPASVRSEWASLKNKGVASIWAPASQDSFHVGNAGVGVVSLRGAPLSLHSSATVQFKRFFDCGRVVRCTLPLGAGRFMHLFVLYGYQGADADPEQLALTDQLFDAALGELSVVARGQPCILVGDFNVEPTKIPCLAKGISAGLWVDLEVSWALANGKQSSSTCLREWCSGGGTRRYFMVGCPFVAAAVLSCAVQSDRWIAPHLAVRALFDYSRWSCRVTQPVRFSPLSPASWLPAVDKSRGSKSVEVRRVWEIYDDRLQFVSQLDALFLSESLDADDISLAWLVWSRAAETALADAYCFSGGPAPCQGLVLVRGVARFWLVRLGGHKVRKVRCGAVGVHDAADVFLYRDSSIAPLLDMRRWFRAVMGVLDAMIRSGVSLARSVELTAQWDRIVAVGPIYPVTLGDLNAVRGFGIGDFHRVASGAHRRLGDFIHSVVVHLCDEAIKRWRNWLREDPLVHMSLLVWMMFLWLGLSGLGLLNLHLLMLIVLVVVLFLVVVWF